MSVFWYYFIEFEFLSDELVVDWSPSSAPELQTKKLDLIFVPPAATKQPFPHYHHSLPVDCPSWLVAFDWKDGGLEAPDFPLGLVFGLVFDGEDPAVVFEFVVGHWNTSEK